VKNNEEDSIQRSKHKPKSIRSPHLAITGHEHSINIANDTSRTNGMRATIRFNEAEQLRLKQLQEYLKEDDVSKIVKFAVDTALNHIKFVTEALVTPDWNVIFVKKRKSMPMEKKFY